MRVVTAVVMEAREGMRILTACSLVVCETDSVQCAGQETHTPTATHRNDRGFLTVFQERSFWAGIATPLKYLPAARASCAP